MNKKDFLNNFTEEEMQEALKVFEKYNLAKNKDIPTFTNIFLTPNICGKSKKLLSNYSLNVEDDGIFLDSERRVLSFNNIYYSEFPTKLLRITNKSAFSGLLHKDYLGAILSLGIQRNKLGDVLVKENCAYVAVMDDIAEYIHGNLLMIGKSPVSVEFVDKYENLPTYDMEERILNISSMRLDAVVSKITNQSRSTSLPLIERGLVLVNYVPIKEKSYEVKENDKITIRKFGKFIIGNFIGKTKSDRMKIIIKKYI